MRFAIYLFGVPVVGIVVSFLMSRAADGLSSNAHFSQLAPYFWHAALAALAVAVVALLWSGWRVYRARTGADDTACYHCSMPTSHKEGRYGPYFKCWNCGLNRADRG